MKVYITKASDSAFREVREMETNGLLKLIREFDSDIIIERTKLTVPDEIWGEVDLSVIIYDDYIE